MKVIDARYFIEIPLILLDTSSVVSQNQHTRCLPPPEHQESIRVSIWRSLLARAAAVLDALRGLDRSSPIVPDESSPATAVEDERVVIETTPEWLKACVNPDAIR